VTFAMPIAAHPQPPRILQIHREGLKPGSEDAYRQIEDDTARICAELGCPHPYLGIESLTGSREVWFFNGYESSAERKHVVDDYAKERIDRPTAEWYYERRQAIAEAGGRTAPASFDACLREWQEDQAEIHTYAAMRAELDLRFRERLLAWGPYLYAELGKAVSKELEQRLIGTGAIQATGFRYVGETSLP